MVKKCTNVVDKQGIEKFCDLFLVGKVQSAIKWDPSVLLVSYFINWMRGSLPDALQMHWPDFDDMSQLFAL